MLEFLKNKYKIIRKIGQGGMAEIYLAEDRVTKKELVLKILRYENANNEVHKKRFLSEIKLTKKVDSPYVIKILDYQWDDKVQYIAFEHIEGENLKEYIARRSRINVDEVVEFSKQIALGFLQIHKLNIFHRDIKAANIMVTEHGSIKIIDFGIAINDESERLTKTDSVIGSVQYIAPEILDQKPATIQTDVYAFGVLMFEMLTGNVPFKGNSAMETAIKHQNKEIPHVNKIFDNIPQSIANIVIKCTAKAPSDRYKNMTELYNDLSSSLKKERTYEPLISFSKHKKKSFTEIMNSKWTLVAIVAILLIALIIAIVVFAIGAK